MLSYIFQLCNINKSDSYFSGEKNPVIGPNAKNLL